MTDKPRLAMFERHSLLDGRGMGYVMPPGTDQGHPFLGKWPHNVGDQFVASGLARALDMDEFITLTRQATPEQFDYVNNECDAIIVVAQNALFPSWFETHLPVSYLRQITIPMIFFSLGLQFRFGDELHLMPGDVESLKYIQDHCASMQVRGHITEALLDRYGITNTRVLGCPSLLHSGTPNIKVRSPSMDRVTFTITDMGRLPDIHAWQFGVIESLIDQAKQMTIATQGGEFVLQEYLALRDGVSFYERSDFDVALENGVPRDEPRTNWTGGLAEGGFVRSVMSRRDLKAAEDSVRWYYRDAPERVRELMISDGFYSPLMAEYIRRARDQSLYVGTRLHGNLMALVQGTPSIFAIHDYRLKDMAEFLEVPSLTIEQNETDISLDECDWTPFEAKWQTIWNGFVDFFEENGLATTIERVESVGPKEA
tara:strand:+ start:11541 stop:12821 length:1281 start_codon:yes stop_codon:yes gene_type:complete